jgi:hypothetical protein
MPATSQEPSGRVCFPKRISNRRLWSTKEGVGETSGQTAERTFRQGSFFSKTSSAEEQVFFIGADPKVRNFTGALRQLRFGPDVFADALVPSGALSTPAILIPENLKTFCLARAGLLAGRLRRWLSLCQMAG